MALFDYFPYTNIHELNLDWITKKIAELSLEWLEHNKEWEKWYNDTNEALADMKQFIIDSFADLQLQEYVNEWLDEHPEATTTVLDGSITEKKLAPSLKKKIMLGNTLTPVYVGDYISKTNNSIPCGISSCLRIGNYFYTLDSPNQTQAVAQRTNEGIIRKFSINANTEIVADRHTANIGHANSIAWDSVNHIVYVAPIWDNTSGVAESAKYLYLFDEDMLPLGKENTPTNAMGVSFDHVTQKLYYYDYNHNIFVKEENAWTLYTNIDFTNIIENEMHPRTYNQDFAVYDNTFYISSPFGKIIYGNLEAERSEVISSYSVSSTDSTGRFFLGELEGMEFTEDGRLYAGTVSNLGSNAFDCFVTELPLEIAISQSTNIHGTNFGLIDGTLTLSEETQIKFALKTYEIRSINQLKTMVYHEKSSAIRIPEGNNVVEEYNITTIDDKTIFLNGTLTTPFWYVFSGHINIYTSNQNNLLTFTHNSTQFEVVRAGRITFSGTVPLNVSLPNAQNGNRFIYIGFYYTISAFRNTPICVQEYELRVGNVAIQNGMYIGATKIPT